MTIDEAIAHCLEVAEQNDAQADKWREEGGEKWGKTTACRECATDHRQLAEWLTELKELREQNVKIKSTLSAALKDITGKNILEIMTVCKLCAMKFQQLCDVFPWQYANEALELSNDEK